MGEAKSRWGESVPPESTIPDQRAAGGPEASAQGDALSLELPGHYAMKRELARGAQAVVFVAHDRHIGRDVAFKQLLPGGPEDAEDRFLREARIAGQLEHPGVVPVYEVGRRNSGQPYCAMRLVRGRTLGDALKSERGRDRLKLLSHFVQLCQTLAYAHQRGVVHRDVKPENVMLGAFGETVLLDWGIARLRGRPDDVSDSLRAPDVNERFDATKEGDVLGTPAYMSPEQALGSVAEVDEQSDVWSLGAVLYEILTGRPPFTDKSAVQVLLKIAKEPIPPVLSVSPEVPRELAFICERALERNKKRRYKSAQDLASDIEAFRAGSRIAGVEYSALDLLRRFVKRNRALSIAIATALVLLIAASAKIWMENREARRFLAQALLEKSAQEASEQRWSTAAAYAAAARVHDDTAEARWRAARVGTVRLDPVWRLDLPSGIEAVAISRKGDRIAAALGDGSIRMLDAAAQTRRTLEPQEGKVSVLAFSPDGEVLAAATGERRLITWNTESGDRLASGDSGALVRDVEFSPDGAQIVTAGADGMIRLFRADDLAVAAALEGHAGPVTSASFASDAGSLISSGEDGTLRLWWPGRVQRTSILRGEGHQPASRALFTAEGTVISASNDGTVRFFSLDGQQITRINTTHGAVVGLSVARGVVAALGQDGTALIIDPASRMLVARMEGDDTANALVLSADGNSLLSANRDGRLRLWRVSTGAHDIRLQGPADFAGGAAIAAAPAGAQVAVGDVAGHVALWDLSKARVSSTLELPSGPVTGLAFSPDGKFLAAAGHDDNAYLFQLPGGARIALSGRGGVVDCVAFSPDGESVAVGGLDGAVRLFRVPGGAQQRVLGAPGIGPVLAVTISPDGELVAAAGEDRAIRIWEAKTGKLLRRMDGSPDAVLALAFSPHASILASAGRDQAIRTWRVSNGKLRSTWRGHGARVWSVAFAPDGETLASASLDGTMRLWDVRTGREVAQLERTPEARALAFAPDGRLLLSTGVKPSLELAELGDKSQLLGPADELQKQLSRSKLRLDGIHLVDDLEALAPAVKAKRKR
ncbi:MAG TPA: protein kinase [Myxococcales bacterium]|nr:protein kinase [Myxococcales bacterium]